MAVRGSSNRLLRGHEPLSESSFDRDESRVFEGVVDIFGDGSAFAISVPGHTPGHVAYVVRTAEFPILIAGDASPTCWGWEHGVETGTFTADRALATLSLAQLRHGNVRIRLGHQTCVTK